MKDPAFLFYSNDFLSGTFTMTDEQVGKYIRLLCIQHQKGILTEKDMINICKSYDEDIYLKFVKTDDNLFYNERLKRESERRKNYSESRSNNRKSNNVNTFNDLKLKNICLTCVNHMETETETIAINENCNKCYKKSNYIKIKKKAEKKFIPPSVDDVRKFFYENGYSVECGEKAFKHYDVANWIDSKGNRVLNWKQKMIGVWFKPENKPIKEPYKGVLA